MSGMTFQELASAGVTAVSHVRSVDPAMFREARRWGIKALTYISLYKMFPLARKPQTSTIAVQGAMPSSMQPAR